MSRTVFIGLVIGAALMGCSHDDPTTPLRTPPVGDRPRLAIIDRTNGGADAFRWLPPIAATADYEGTNDAAAAPTVEICVQSGAQCAVFATSGANLPVPSVEQGKKGAGQYYSLSWNTRLFSLDPAKAYSIIVRLGGKQQGFADVDVVATAADLANVPQGFVGVVAGDQLDINFRLVRGVTRTWVGGAVGKGKNATPGSETDWATAANWSPEGIPFRLDTAVIPVAAQQPALVASATVGRVTVNDGATLTIGGFDLTLNAGASTAGSGKISATSGLLLLAGAGSIAGALPRFVVTGDYALGENVTTPAMARIAGGRLTTAGRLLAVTP